MDVKRDFLYRLSLVLTPPVYTILTRLLFATCRITENNREYWDRCSKAGPVISAFWHYGISYSIHLARGKQWVAMVSSSRDGEYIARILEWMGYETVRGSRTRGGLGALKKMMSRIREGINGAIVADGSQGPPRKVQAGAILLASRTGTPIIPMAWAADRHIRFNSWDRTILPKPFARISLWYGEPLEVPADLGSEEVEKYRVELEDRLNTAYSRAWNDFGKEEH
ncbi:MAG: lysophospholipid acyltransferase family protein [Desulfobulbaceae bacterium]|nr:lysophospholipid acyltransferase family protein [Desulfobulbaceae bacterium]MCK5323083.1 lysophospholipid acyltransferase family protein [Desulfobulbaceae bacterium]MCK5436951.1 lysophospholipid acyltransferase family protein [Desulfobulbaceae bacterium]MCK5544288.1 lysophospholipid acyltransferase family protein [Desulfobulbaceae bacterium]